MFSDKCKLQGLNGIKQLDRVGPYLVIANRQRHEKGGSNRYALVNESELWVHSVHGSQLAAVVIAQNQNQ
jgi:hypothetical protein